MNGGKFSRERNTSSSPDMHNAHYDPINNIWDATLVNTGSNKNSNTQHNTTFQQAQPLSNKPNAYLKQGQPENKSGTLIDYSV